MTSYDPGYFQGGNPATGQQATVVTADWLNGVQEEIMAVIEWAGLTPDAEKTDQLKKAIALKLAGLEAFTPPTEEAPGKNGLVPAPAVMSEEQAQNSYLGADGNWHSMFGTPDYDNYVVVGTYKSTKLGDSTRYDYVMPTDGYLWCLNRLLIPKNGILNAVIYIAKKEVVKNYQGGASSIQASHLIPVRKGTAVTFSLYMSSDATEPSEMDVRLYPLRRGD